MPAVLSTLARNVERGSLLGRNSDLLSEDVLREPGKFLFGAKPGPDREFIMALLHPLLALRLEVQQLLGVDVDDTTAYGLVACLAVRLRKTDDSPLVAADFSRT
jgi:hypothetical protein